ncbi:MAG: 6-phosphofructokinase [Actinobacteria bacterium]|nr:6-phosphofructokinase [Actinomycetota bacterium]
MIKKIGLITGGGDSPGINAAIRAIVIKGIQEGYEILGIRCGWRGLIEDDVVKLELKDVEGIINTGGTIIGTSRTNPFKIEGGEKALFRTIKKHGIDAIIAIGGDDTLRVAHKLNPLGIPAVGIPQTIDNDLCGTDYCIGFDSAVCIVTDAIDKLQTTAASHRRIIVVEIMGRDSGWLTLIPGIAAAADIILVPEDIYDYQSIVERIQERIKRGKQFAIIAVAEGSTPNEVKTQISETYDVDAFGHIRLGGIANLLAEELEKRIKLEIRSMNLGHLQRGGNPSPMDRYYATRLGLKAVELVKEKKFDMMTSVQGNEISAVPLEAAICEVKKVSAELIEISKTFG